MLLRLGARLRGWSIRPGIDTECPTKPADRDAAGRVARPSAPGPKHVRPAADHRGPPRSEALYRARVPPAPPVGRSVGDAARRERSSSGTLNVVASLHSANHATRPGGMWATPPAGNVQVRKRQTWLRRTWLRQTWLRRKPRHPPQTTAPRAAQTTARGSLRGPRYPPGRGARFRAAMDERTFRNRSSYCSLPRNLSRLSPWQRTKCSRA